MEVEIEGRVGKEAESERRRTWARKWGKLWPDLD